MMKVDIKIIFFGSFLDHSATILQKLISAPHITVSGVVTTPPKPAGRQKKTKITPVHKLAQENNLPVFTPEKLNSSSLANIPSVDLFVTAGYGKLLSKQWLEFPQVGAINLHFSLLPKFRGANPAEWAILLGEKITGITLIEMADKFDTGHIISQQQISIDSKDTRVTLYEKLYSLAAKHVPNMLLKHYRWLQKKDFA